MNHQQIVDYLLDNPSFFEENAHMLEHIQLNSAVEGRAISLHERQVEILRCKYKALEMRISALIRLAQENDTISQKFQQFTNQLLLTQDTAIRADDLVRNLQTIFNVPQVSLRLWEVAPGYQHTWFAQPVSEDVKVFTAGLSAPYCGKNNGFKAISWLPDPGAVKSTAMLPLRTQCIQSGVHPRDHSEKPYVFGLLVLGSPDIFRFTAEMAIDFLLRVSDTASAALDNMREQQSNQRSDQLIAA